MSYFHRFRYLFTTCIVVIGTTMFLGGNVQAKGSSEKKVIKVEMKRGETKVVSCNGPCKGVTVEVTLPPEPVPPPPVPTKCPAKAPCVKCPGCPVAAVQPPAPAPSMFKIDVGIGVGGIGVDRKVGFGGALNLGVEFRLNSWAGLLLGANFGLVTGPIVDTKPGSGWGTFFGAAFWPTPTVRFLLGGGYQGLRNSRWNLRTGGPVAMVGVDILAISGWSIGMSGYVGTGWKNPGGKLAAFYAFQPTIRWFFGGRRK